MDYLLVKFKQNCIVLYDEKFWQSVDAISEGVSVTETII